MSDQVQSSIVIKEVFRTRSSSDEVWKAITDRDEMAQWYFKLAEFRAEPGFEFRFTGGPAPDRQYDHVCVVKEVIPRQKLSYSWRYEGFAGDTVVSFSLRESGNETVLTLTHEGLQSLPQDNPDFAVANFAAGWKEIIGRSLAQHLSRK